MPKKMKRKLLNENTSENSNESTWAKNYASSHSILLVGEGDFSFALALTKMLGSGDNITASSLDARGDLFNKYKNARDNVLELERLGAIVLHEVDATKLGMNANLKLRKFDRIVYNFPHAGFLGQETSPSLIKLHQELVLGYLKSASRMLHPRGEIHVTHRTDKPFCDWNIEELASKCSLDKLECTDFEINEYPGYAHKKGGGKNCDYPFPLKGAVTFKFVARRIHKRKRASILKFVARKIGKKKCFAAIRLRDLLFHLLMSGCRGRSRGGRGR